MDFPYDLLVRCALEPHGNVLNIRGLHNRLDHHDLKVRAQPSPDKQRMKNGAKRIWISLMILSFAAPSKRTGTY